MDIMGPGIYISLSCSPFINKNEMEIPIDKEILSIVGERIIEEVSEINLNIWKKYYMNYRSIASLRNRKKTYKQEIFDDVGVKSGKKETGVGLSKRGRITYKTKLYEPNTYMTKKEKKEKKEKDSNNLSDWTSSMILVNNNNNNLCIFLCHNVLLLSLSEEVFVHHYVQQ